MCQSSALHASGALLTLFLSQNCFCMRGLTILCSAFLFGINPLSQILSQNYLPKMSVLCPVDSTFTWSLRMSRSGHISVLYFFKLNTISSNSLIQLWFSEENVMYSFYGRCCHFPLIDVFVFVFCFFLNSSSVSWSLCWHLRWDFHPGVVYWTDVCRCLTHPTAANYMLCQKK